MIISTPYLNPLAFVQSLQTEYHFDHSMKWNAHNIELPSDIGKGNMQVFIRNKMHFIRYKVEKVKNILFHSSDEVGSNGLIDFRFSKSGELFSAVLENKKEYEWELTDANRFGIFLPATAVKSDKSKLYKRIENGLNNATFQNLLGEIFSIPTDDFDSPLLLESKFLQFTHHWLKIINTNESTNTKSYISETKLKGIQKVKEILDGIPETIPNILQLGRIAGMNQNCLQRIFKKNTGFTIRQYLIKQRMTKARELVLNTDLPITEICHITGYVNRGHFSKLYEKFFGMLPSQHRLRN
ncbi:MAG: AraC family transcriptional regulator [Bacteroidota bacterium]